MKENTFRVGQKVAIVQSMTFVGRAPSIVRESVITRVTAAHVWVKGREWSDGSGRFNPDDKYRSDGRATDSTSDYSIRAL